MNEPRTLQAWKWCTAQFLTLRKALLNHLELKLNTKSEIDERIPFIRAERVKRSLSLCTFYAWNMPVEWKLFWYNPFTHCPIFHSLFTLSLFSFSLSLSHSISLSLPFSFFSFYFSLVLYFSMVILSFAQFFFSFSLNLGHTFLHTIYIYFSSLFRFSLLLFHSVSLVLSLYSSLPLSL